MLSWVPSKLNRLPQKSETNLGSLSDTMTSGTPWCLTTVSTKTRASWGAVMEVLTGARWTRLDNRSNQSINQSINQSYNIPCSMVTQMARHKPPRAQ